MPGKFRSSGAVKGPSSELNQSKTVESISRRTMSTPITKLPSPPSGKARVRSSTSNVLFVQPQRELSISTTSPSRSCQAESLHGMCTVACLLIRSNSIFIILSAIVAELV